MTVDLSKPDAMPDYGAIANLLDNFNARRGIEVSAYGERVVMADRKALLAWRTHIDNWFTINKGNRAV